MKTIALNQNLYNTALIYAKQHNTSLTEIVESYLLKLLKTNSKKKTQTRTRLENRIKEIKAFTENWDHEGASSISTKVCQTASNILKACKEEQIKNLAIFPNRSGNIFMQWETAKGDACLAISENSLSYNVCIGENDSYGKLDINKENVFLDKLNEIL